VSLPSRSKTARLCSSSSFGCEAWASGAMASRVGVACSHVLGRIILLLTSDVTYIFL
jgi:hypothetical protein